ncbi:MAG: primosomal protein N' [Spirochaetia bacterium]|nr:primosomal protein N' [Spirochaetia bacterium]
MPYIKTAVFSAVDSLLTYRADDALPEHTGCRVIVPLGNNSVTAVIVEVLKDADIPDSKIKNMREFLDEEPVLTKELINLGLWLADYYIASPGLVFATMLAALNKVISGKIATIEDRNAEVKGRQLEVVDYIISKDGQASVRDMERRLKIPGIHAVLNALVEKGVISIEEKERSKGIRKKMAKPGTGEKEEDKHLVLNTAQQAAVDAIKISIQSGNYKTFLLFGATGSGKTEVYIHAAREAAALGKKSIILVPEIFLTPQVVERFKREFGDEVALYHSALKPAERLHEWTGMKNGEAQLVVGTRSAIFAPFENPGLIVVDEEFDSSYKQESEPRYNARDAAVYRASKCGATVVLGSATPSVETYYNAQSGKYTMLKLPDRVAQRPMPVINVIDLKFDGNRNKDLMFSDDMVREINYCVDNGGQAILFINRRGFSSYNYCIHCGRVEKCVNCEIPLVYHKTGNEIKCHYCGYTKKPELLCPSCKKPIFYKGAGTQRVEDVITKFFPDKRVARVDIDSMKDKKSYFDIYRKIKDREIDILIGTQMIAKGFDFPEVTFVGVVTIDTVLNLPDFRSEERAFQLLMQVAGRTGRGEKTGRVVIQTFNPDISTIKRVKNYEIEQFYEDQLKLRREMCYPPFGKLVQIIIQDESEEKAISDAERVADIIRKKGLKGASMLGPAEAPLSRIRNKYRQSIILKSTDRAVLNALGKEVRKECRGMDVTVVVDPINTL